jgi:hypothetical protein
MKNPRHQLSPISLLLPPLPLPLLILRQQLILLYAPSKPQRTMDVMRDLLERQHTQQPTGEMANNNSK